MNSSRTHRGSKSQARSIMHYSNNNIVLKVTNINTNRCKDIDLDETLDVVIIDFDIICRVP